MEVTLQEQPTTNASSSKSPTSYAQVSQNTLFLKKENAIVIDSADQAPSIAFVQIIATKVNPSLIRFASKISNKRLCIYFTNKETADDLVNNHKSIIVEGHEFPIRPLISRNKRVILSNVCPSIPHYVIENKLLSFGIKTVTPISFLRAGFSDPRLSHILSFRRQTFIAPEDEKKLPESFQVLLDDLPHWIYVSSDVPICFQCKRQGHLAKDCSSTSEVVNGDLSSQMPSTSHQVDPPAIQIINNDPVSSPQPLPPQLESMENVPVRTTTAPSLIPSDFPALQPETTSHLTSKMKRPLSSTNSNTTNSISLTDSENETSGNVSELSDSDKVPEVLGKPVKKASKQSKKIKPNSDYIDETLWNDTKAMIEAKSSEFPLSMNQLLHYFDITKGITDITDITRSVTDNPIALAEMLRQIHSTLPSKAVKNQCTRLMKKLKATKVVNTDTEQPTS